MNPRVHQIFLTEGIPHWLDKLPTGTPVRFRTTKDRLKGDPDSFPGLVAQVPGWSAPDHYVRHCHKSPTTYSREKITVLILTEDIWEAYCRGT